MASSVILGGGCVNRAVHKSLRKEERTFQSEMHADPGSQTRFIDARSHIPGQGYPPFRRLDWPLTF